MRVRPVYHLLLAALVAEGAAMSAPVPENVYIGELLSYPGPAQFQIGRAGIILVRDEELETLARDPDAVLDLSLTFDKREESLRRICERAQAGGQRTLLISFDHFFKQYRPGTDAPRRLMPDTDEYIALIGQVAKFAQGYGLALELSLISPLEVGPGYRRATGEAGLWMHYRKGLRDPQTGAYSVQLWRQTQWVNNKGPIAIEDAGVRVFAFREHRVGGGAPYLVVNPADIVEISDGAEVEVYVGLQNRGGDYRSERVRIHGAGHTDLGPLDRVLVVQQYRTPEMDYFSDQALPFLNGLVDRYADAGIKLNGLYSDEMHIQQDWNYFGHHDHGEFALRYVSPGLQRRFAAQYGPEYADFAKYLIYFCRGQEDTRNDLTARAGLQHVFGGSPEEIRRTSLFRSRYFKLLQDGVVDLFVAARRHAEERMGHLLDTRAHATWAESPTVDRWDTEGINGNTAKYEYTPNFVWSVTVHQAASACHDYFKWGEYLTGTGNDHSEGGWLDRDYFGLALACSTGIINEVPYSYAAHWGSPHQVSMRHGWLQAAFGTASSPLHGMVEGLQHRDVDVLMLYPLDLVSVDERFGSWMTQYGYANFLTSAKLLELGRVENGAVVVAGRRFTTLVALFEPHPPAALIELMGRLVAAGGKVVWSGPPPLISAEGEPLLPAWSDLFGADLADGGPLGLTVPGQVATFEGPLAPVQPQTILTDFALDRIYPVAPRDGTIVCAHVGRRVVGTQRGTATFVGLRPRDDQAQSLGYDARTWFDILDAVGAYPPTGKFAGVDDNTESLSREPGTYLYCRFPNGALAIAPHLRDYVESWPGGFGRKPEDDAKFMEQNPPPPPNVDLDEAKVWGHTVTYHGQGAVSFRVDDQGRLVAFSGNACAGITVDGRAWQFAEQPMGTAFWAPVPPERRVPNGAVMVLALHGKGSVRVPAIDLPPNVEVVTQGAKPGSRGNPVACHVDGDALVVELGDGVPHQYLYVVPK